MNMRFAVKCVFLGVLYLHAQEQSPVSFSAGVKVVNVLATVRGKHGQIVSNLNQDDFILAEDGRPQTIRYFSQETNLPLTLGLLVDTSLSQRRVLPDERTASYRFLSQILREDKDVAFVIHFDRDVELLQDLTSSRKNLEAALELLETPEPGQWPRPSSSGSSGSVQHHRRAGGTSLYDAVLLASDDLMKKQTGRKGLIILSDGVDTGSKVTLMRAIESAQRAETLVYSILFADEQAYSRGFGNGPYMGRHGSGGRGRMPESHPDGKKILKQISEQPGGDFFEVPKRELIAQIYDHLREELRNQYSIGYTSDKADTGSGYRKIALSVKQKGLEVRARDGRYADN